MTNERKFGQEKIILLISVKIEKFLYLLSAVCFVRRVYLSAVIVFLLVVGSPVVKCSLSIVFCPSIGDCFWLLVVGCQMLAVYCRCWLSFSIVGCSALLEESLHF